MLPSDRLPAARNYDRRPVRIARGSVDFAAIVLKALSENLDQKVGDIFSTARLSKELRGDQSAHLAYSSCIPLFAFPDYARC